MNTENKNLPAYPKATPDGDAPQKGLTKRELIAAMCLQGVLSNSSTTNDVADMIKSGKYNVTHGKSIFAEIAIQAADELLNQLNSTP